MTLVYQREVAERPATHAFVLGCGRFTHLGPTANRRATVAGARAIIRHLVEHRDEMIAPLATVECLLSDPAVQRGHDTLGLGALPGNELVLADDKVDPILTATVEPAGSAWLERCRPGDHMFFYMSSHGVADKGCSAAGLFENVLQNRFKRWSASLNISVLAGALPVVGAGACWVFLDACQEIIGDILERDAGTSGVMLLDASAAEIANTRVQALALAGSRYGQKAWAPDDDKPPYFTQALLEGLQSCIEPSDEDNIWFVTGGSLQNKIPLIADATFGYDALDVWALTPFASPLKFARIEDPKVPIVLRTANIVDMADMHCMTIEDDVNASHTINPIASNCFARLSPDRKYTATASFRPPTAYPAARFTARPGGQIVMLKP